MTNAIVDIFKKINLHNNDQSVCWEWLGAWGGRQDQQRPYYNYEGQRDIAYRVVYSLVHGVSLGSAQSILHSCDNGSRPIGCCNPSHLRIGTVQENSDDMTARARHGLPHNTVKAIRRLAERGKTQAEIAEVYGIARTTVQAIVTGRTYGHVARDFDKHVTTEEDDSELIDKSATQHNLKE